MLVKRHYSTLLKVVSTQAFDYNVCRAYQCSWPKGCQLPHNFIDDTTQNWVGSGPNLMQSDCNSLSCADSLPIFLPFLYFHITVLPGICESLSYLTQEAGLECDRHACGGLEGGARAHTHWRVKQSKGLLLLLIGTELQPPVSSLTSEWWSHLSVTGWSCKVFIEEERP